MNGRNIHALESADGGVSVFQDGIFVTQVTALLPEGARQYIVTRINLLGQDKMRVEHRPQTACSGKPTSCKTSKELSVTAW